MNSSSTTLMTFLVRTPPNTRSVKLFGSWDNFTRAYPMEKDSRMGRGHWKGCHTFTNIICDGETTPSAPGRDGGLRMGGTYWYYYQLDNEVDFFNEAEPVTTSCALLPGQPLNVLNVPIHLPSSQTHPGRGTRPGSRISNHETMDPADKYMNPRAPPRPALPRLTTSPAKLMRTGYGLTSPLSSGSSLPPVNERRFSHPRALSTRRRIRVGGKLSLDLKISINHSPKANSLRSAILNFTSPRFGENEESRGRRHHKIEKSHIIRVPEPESYSITHCNNLSPTWSIADSLNKPLPLPQNSYVADGYVPCEYSSRNQFLGESRRPSPLKNTWAVEDPLAHRLDSGATERTRYLDIDPYQESVAQQSTPRVIVPHQSGGDMLGPETSSPLGLNGKRLPSLPHSPTSAIDAEFHSAETAHLSLGDEEYLQSHFSDFTADSPDNSYSPDSFLQPGGSRFSEYSTDTDNASPCSMTSASTFNNDNTFSSTAYEDNEVAFEAALTDPSAPPSSLSDIASNTSPQPNVYINSAHQHRESKSSGSCSGDLGLSALYISNSPGNEVERWSPKADKTTNHGRKASDAHPATPSWTSLILKHSNFTPKTNSFVMDDNPELRTPRANPANRRGQLNNKDSEQISSRGGDEQRRPKNCSVKSSTMQDLMDELSYLGGVIEDNAVKSC
ncbi:hypothetical protein BDDG_08882 [Blastomyces dermatitidis ATCC 18188]|uniref:Uncharacterized protein n=1 Tax=Ajellomyces dermatitidis (strain ATCC 18188 / CBS 674.68) TaxID=653446 RepID=F2TRS4_AJEDA|nr:hypothetical protein BDDG_08882 [Blastomyces dermatitidis ATCC 18188]EQL28962.1 hypothetical protein BDFG_08320 [Blastomyces dermatitidis ATCC 26199]